MTDDEAGTVTFQLTAPDPEFLYKLAIPFGSILPAGTPLSKDGARPVPATGPYVIRSATRKRLDSRPQSPLPRLECDRPARLATWIGSRSTLNASRSGSDHVEVARGAADVVSGSGAFGAALTNFETQHPAQVHAHARCGHLLLVPEHDACRRSMTSARARPSATHSTEPSSFASSAARRRLSPHASCCRRTSPATDRTAPLRRTRARVARGLLPISRRRASSFDRAGRPERASPSGPGAP